MVKFITCAIKEDPTDIIAPVLPKLKTCLVLMVVEFTMTQTMLVNLELIPPVLPKLGAVEIRPLGHQRTTLTQPTALKVEGADHAAS